MVERRPFNELGSEDGYVLSEPRLGYLVDGAANKDVIALRITAIEDSELMMVGAPWARGYPTY
jgi:hypothetical protein